MKKFNVLFLNEISYSDYDDGPWWSFGSPSVKKKKVKAAEQIEAEDESHVRELMWFKYDNPFIVSIREIHSNEN